MATTELDGRTTFQTLVKNASGQYILNMPAGNVTLSAEFVLAENQTGTTPANAANTAPKTNSAQSQVVGALAVAVVTNKNEAVVDTTGTIQAGGNVILHANGVTQSTTLADGSPIATPTTGNENGSGSASDKTNERPQGDSITQPQKKTYTYKETVEVPNPPQGGPTTTEVTKTIEVQTSATANGKINFKSNNDPVFDTTADTGYKFKEGSLKFSYTKADGTTVTGVLVKGTGTNNYILPKTETKGDGTVVDIDYTTVGLITISAEFEEVLHNITSSVVKEGSGEDGAKVNVKATAHESEKVTVTVDLPSGQKVKKVTYNGKEITPNNGKYVFEMLNEDVAIVVTVAVKDIAIEVLNAADNTDAKKYITTSDTHADIGEEITIALSETAKAEGKKVTKATVEIIGGADILAKMFSKQWISILPQ